MIQTKRIFIIGHPGAGKALLAKTVAGRYKEGLGNLVNLSKTIKKYLADKNSLTDIR